MKLAVILVATWLASSAHATTLSMRIAVEPEALLPGIPPSLRVSVTNHGSEPAEMPARVALQVIPPRGQPFIAYSTLRGDELTMNLPAEPPLILAARETRDVSLWSGDSWFAADERFRTSGTFQFQLVADSELDSQRLSALSRIVDQDGLVQPLISNETTFSVVEPTGADLAVWNVMKAQGTLCSAQATELIWSDYPTSRYAAYCVRNQNDPDVLKRIAGYEASLAKNPHPYWADGYRLGIAQFWVSRASGLIDHDIEAAVDAYDRARAILEPLAKRAAAPEHRYDATQLLELRVRSRDEVVERHRAAHGSGDRSLRIYVSCHQNLPGGERSVWFGYNTPNQKPIDVPVGRDNKLTPPPFSRGQPTRFEPGIVDFAFPIVTKEPVLVWHLQGKTVQFKVPGSTECPPGFDPEDPSTWPDEDR